MDRPPPFLVKKNKSQTYNYDKKPLELIPTAFVVVFVITTPDAAN